MKFLIVDDNDRFRTYLRETILATGDECRELDDGTDVNAVYAEFQPDWVLLDIRMKQMNGLVAGELLNKQYPDARFVMVSNYDDERFCRKAMTIGARALIAKDNLVELETLLRH